MPAGSSLPSSTSSTKPGGHIATQREWRVQIWSSVVVREALKVFDSRGLVIRLKCSNFLLLGLFLFLHSIYTFYCVFSFNEVQRMVTVG